MYQLSIVKTSGKEFYVEDLIPGQVFCEAALGGTPINTVSAFALCPVELAVISYLVINFSFGFGFIFFNLFDLLSIFF